MTINADDVAEFLQSNPQFFAPFFEQHPELLETIYVPHPYGGRAIPLSERQMVSLREKARVLEGKLGELIQFGEDNDAISEKVHRLAIAIAGARDFPVLTRALYFHLREDFAVPHVALRVWGKAVPADFPEAEPVSEALRREAEALGDPRCGPAGDSPFTPSFGESAEHVRSLAVVPLGQTAVFGALLLGSEDPKRFYVEMGTLYLRRIGELLAAGIAARL
jgi:uncharacterized protein YigA (DUF484 family)